MNGASAIAMSGMFAAEQRLNVAAYNIANATTGVPADGQAVAANAFQALRADQTEAPGGGTAVTVTQFPNDALGGADFASEAIQVVTARYTFAANVAVMRTAAQMQKVLLDTFA
jgi:flagellar basal body rod protein FlgC